MPPEGGKEQLDSAKNTFFANRGEKVVFWASVAGLLLVTTLTGFRYFTSKRMEQSSRQIEHLEFAVDSLQIEIAAYKAVLDSMRQGVGVREGHITLQQLMSD